MKPSTVVAAVGRNARLAAVGGVAAIVVSVSVSACSTGRPPSGSPTFSPGGTASPTGTVTPSSTVTPTGTVTPTTPAPSDTATHTHSASPSPSPWSASPSLAPSPTPSSMPSPIPTVAPATGGGGTAGFQDGVLPLAGVAAILALARAASPTAEG